MAENERIKRIDKIGNTEAIPHARTVQDVKSQRWIANRFFRLMGRGDCLWDYLGLKRLVHH